MAKFAYSSPTFFNPGKVEEEIWYIKGHKATRQRHIRDQATGYEIIEYEPGEEPLEVVHYPNPRRVFGIGSLLEFL